MAFNKTYQVTDSLSTKNEKDSFNKKGLKELELIEEIDESAVFPKAKKNNEFKVIDTNVSPVDTVFGIENESAIPIRKVEYVVEKETLTQKLFDPNPIITNVSGWQTIILVGLVSLLGIAKAFSSNRFNQSIKALFSYAVAQEISREEKVFFHRSNVLFSVIHLMATALFLYHVRELLNMSSVGLNGGLLFLLIVTFLILLYMVKYIFSKILFFILDAAFASEYIFNVSLYNNLLGIILIPILSISYFSSLPFSSVLIYIAIPMILLTLLLRVVRLYTIGISKGISYFYIFLYICTLEILPLVVLIRIFVLK